MPANQSAPPPKADQPRATTEQLQRRNATPSLTARTSGIKNMGRRTPRAARR